MATLSCALVGLYPMQFQFGYDEEHVLCQNIKLEMVRQIQILYQNGVTDFYTNCEAGPPMWGAEAVLALSQRRKALRLYCAIPYEEQASKWTPALRERYFNILADSTDSYFIQNRLTNKSYPLCGQHLADKASFMLAVYDPGAPVQFDPATFAVNAAKEQGKGIIFIHPDTAKVTPIQVEAKHHNGFTEENGCIL